MLDRLLHLLNHLLHLVWNRLLHLLHGPVASAAGCDVCLTWAWVEKFDVVNAAAGLASAAESVLAVLK